MTEVSQSAQSLLSVFSLEDSVLQSTQNSIQLKAYELFILEMFYLVFSNLSWSPVPGIVEKEASDNG